MVETNPGLIVAAGQVTFDAEGNDNPDSIYYSRVAHKPPGISGVTIGRGYDLGHRGSRDIIEKELTDAGIDLDAFSGAIGLQGNEAQSWLNANKDQLPELTYDQQKKLFEYTYSSMEATVKRICNKSDVVAKYGGTDFDTLNNAILQIVVDMTFRGDYTPASRRKVQTLIANNDFDGFFKAMSDQAYWSNVPSDRFKRRVQFLDEAKQDARATTTPAAKTQQAAAPQQPAASKPATYVVQSGESLSVLAAKFNTTIDALKAANTSKLKRWGSVEGFNAGEEIDIP